MYDFVPSVKRWLDIIKSIIDGPILFNGCRIVQDAAGDIEMNMELYLNSIALLDLSRDRRKMHDCKATSSEYDACRSLAGSIIWPTNGAVPYVSYFVSAMQQTAPQLQFGDIAESNNMLKEIRDLSTYIMLNKPDREDASIQVWTHSYASFNIMSGKIYGQSGIVTGLMLMTSDDRTTFQIG